jgi:hypothetical protein
MNRIQVFNEGITKIEQEHFKNVLKSHRASKFQIFMKDD